MKCLPSQSHLNPHTSVYCWEAVAGMLTMCWLNAVRSKGMRFYPSAGNIENSLLGTLFPQKGKDMKMCLKSDLFYSKSLKSRLRCAYTKSLKTWSGTFGIWSLHAFISWKREVCLQREMFSGLRAKELHFWVSCPFETTYMSGYIILIELFVSEVNICNS